MSASPHFADSNQISRDVRVVPLATLVHYGRPAECLAVAFPSHVTLVISIITGRSLHANYPPRVFGRPVAGCPRACCGPVTLLHLRARDKSAGTCLSLSGNLQRGRLQLSMRSGEQLQSVDLRQAGRAQKTGDCIALLVKACRPTTDSERLLHIRGAEA